MGESQREHGRTPLSHSLERLESPAIRSQIHRCTKCPCLTSHLPSGELVREKRGSCLWPSGCRQISIVTHHQSLLSPSCPKPAWDRKRASETKPNRPPNPQETDNKSPHTRPRAQGFCASQNTNKKRTPANSSHSWTTSVSQTSASHSLRLGETFSLPGSEPPADTARTSFPSPPYN